MSHKQITFDKVVKQNPNLEKVFKEDLKSWPLYATPKILPSTNSKVFYVGDAFNGFLPTLAQGAGQSIESAYELFKDIENNTESNFFKNRVKKTKMVNVRSKFNQFAFHLSNPLTTLLRNIFLKRLVKNKKFLEGYLGKIYKN